MRYIKACLPGSREESPVLHVTLEDLIEAVELGGMHCYQEGLGSDPEFSLGDVWHWFLDEEQRQRNKE